MRYPLAGSMLRSRAVCAGLGGFVALQVGLSAMGLGLTGCAMLYSTGLPCPGCGMTRSAVAAARLDLDAVVYYNAFGPVALVAGVVFLIGLVLPTRARDRWADLVCTVERATGLTLLLLVAMSVYWAVRLSLLGGELGERLSVHGVSGVVPS